MVLPRLGEGQKGNLRLEMKLEARNETRNLLCGEFCDSEPCLKTNFGISVKALPNISTKMGGGKTVLGQMAYLNLLMNARLYGIWNGAAHFREISSIFEMACQSC
ncbi:hypothetical protein AVEN_127791-1 [Araneus ventricosus]|uniref:Uncharacterized protein n=1 Tax=Araneus ventricosus TaxID=182803 RepID=A0A4Y2DRD8_ARAVE|nr:hypothetical protein AVEN_127791-1 [Araneus ventricosus]